MVQARSAQPRDGHSTHDIADSGLGVAVPAAQGSRVAEWSLGEEIVVVDRVAGVAFESLPPSG
jgi:hypothetical protein